VNKLKKKYNFSSYYPNKSKTTKLKIKNYIASPSLNSRFSPGMTIQNSPWIMRRTFQAKTHNENITSAGKKDFLNIDNHRKQIQKNVLLRYTQPIISSPSGNYHESEYLDTDENVSINHINISKNKNNDLKTIDELSSPRLMNIEVNKVPQIFIKNIPTQKDSQNIIQKTLKNISTPEQSRIEIQKVVNHYDTSCSESSIDESFCQEQVTTLPSAEYSGYIFKITMKNKFKKIWFRVVDNDLFYYKTSTCINHRGMHNLCGAFLHEEQPLVIKGKSYFCFSIVYPNKSRYYYIEKEEEYKEWVSCLKKVMKYQNVLEYYEMGKMLGQGRFGTVRVVTHKDTGKKFAVKIMNKKDMTISELEMVKNEIEILKICHHPNIIKLHEVFENKEKIYLIMERCTGGDLFTWFEKRNFKISEHKAFQIIHKLCTAIYYLHSYGIVHRDLKLENILMTDSSENADIKLLDFGLSKMIGPNENCNEPFGTIVRFFIKIFIVLCCPRSIT
jgi:tRNA A-37 threonylcarbamoyl transferase component Bud32